MSDFDFEKWKLMNHAPFTYCAAQLISAFKGLSFILGVIFVCLYMVDKIDWSLWWVTLPFWYYIPILAITSIIDFIRDYFKEKKKKTW